MKVGTLNFHRSQNYGAMMVSYSLITYLKKIGIEACPIDYFPEHHTAMYPTPNKPYDDFAQTFLTPFSSPDDSYDLIVYGADTIWERYKNFGYDEVYWGSDRLKARHRVAFSASATMKNFSQESDGLFKKYLNGFDAVSVREDVLKEYIEPWYNGAVAHTCDPTFLLDPGDYELIMSPKLIEGEYAVIYNRQLGAKLFEVAKAVEEKSGLKTVVLKGDGCLYGIDENRIRADIGPCEFLSLIRYSSYVLAASFHAVAFSVIFNKQFNTIMKSGAERVESLLRRLDLESRRIDHSREIDMNRKIDYTKLDKLYEYIDYSKHWLNGAVEITRSEGNF